MQNEETRKALSSMSDDFEESIMKLPLISDVINVFIDHYGLGNTNRTDEEKFNLAHSADALASLFYLVQSEIRSVNESFDRIHSKYLPPSD